MIVRLNGAKEDGSITHWQHRFLKTAAFISVLSLIPPAFGKPPALETETNRLVVCISSPVESMDPTNYRDRTTQTVLKNMFDSLTTRDSMMRIVPQLAESWKSLDDTTWEFKLRQGVKFHNGDPFTAEDVKFTLERVVKEGAIDGQTSHRKSLLGPVSGVNIIDAHTVLIQTEKPWAILPLMLSLQEIVPKKYMESVGSAGFQSNPIGTGPFRLASQDAGKEMILEVFPDYYGGSPGNPPMQPANLKYLVFRTVPLKALQIAMLKLGECDIVSHIPVGAIRILKQTPGIRVLTCSATRSYFAEINCAKPPFNDLRVRRALNHAINRKAVVDNILQGHGIPLPTILLPNAFAFNRSLKPYAYDPELAKRLLIESTFPETDTVAIQCVKDDLQFANIIAAFLTKVGIKSAINIVHHRKPKAYGRDASWDILVGSWGNSTLDPVGILVPKFKSGGRGNFSGYRSKEVDALLSLAETTSNPTLRKDYFEKVQKIVYGDVPMIFGYAAEEFYGVREMVKNFIPSSSGMMNMHDVSIKIGTEQ